MGKSYADIQGVVSSSDSKAYIAAQGQESLAIFLCVLIMTYIISLTVVYVRSMLVYNCRNSSGNESVYSIFCNSVCVCMCDIYITYVFCVAALERKET